jgi:hypothetical protein
VATFEDVHKALEQNRFDISHNDIFKKAEEGTMLRTQKCTTGRTFPGMTSIFYGLLLLIVLSLSVLPGEVHAGQVVLSWEPPSAEYGGFILSYGTQSGNYAIHKDVGGQASYTVTNVEPGQTYYFAVKAYDPFRERESPYSNEVSTTVSVSDNNPLPGGGTYAGEVALAWDPPSAEYGGFILSYGTQSGNYAIHKDVGGQPFFTVTNLEPGQTYYLAVKAYDPFRNHESPYSNEVSITVADVGGGSGGTGNPPAAPQGVRILIN